MEPWLIMSNLEETKGFRASATCDFNIKFNFFPEMLQKP